eukprot:CAMPEP_0116018734 /NCGR_PEP_ID=MMETSP0321-20121206/8820_1 /TAXON_ID=163516 /ORGANISM="Leptocylindrus danicus var. danicus, Strain B650" /LENGTH=59 /DNA_ID=CAMNT_0003489175 /DNA_START=296 /DNA_END=475 /DNA_ORIENTATION=+
MKANKQVDDDTAVSEAPTYYSDVLEEETSFVQTQNLQEHVDDQHDSNDDMSCLSMSDDW